MVLKDLLTLVRQDTNSSPKSDVCSLEAFLVVFSIEHKIDVVFEVYHSKHLKTLRFTFVLGTF